MSESVKKDELRARLERLVEDARRDGRLAELEQIFRSLTTVPDTAASTGEMPMRFGMVGDSAPMQAVFKLLERVVESDVSVLVHGETGTGKELVAQALHKYGHRKAKPFLAENCAAVPANLLESELFGHKKGSFTGAIADRPGHFVAADGGTVFLDEIGDMPLAMQSKLLRVLQDGEVRAVGANTSKKVDVRVVAATNKDLVAMCKAGTFREDLYFRLNVVTITLPPLRERKGDIAHLTQFFLKKIGAEMNKQVAVTPEALIVLEGWKWPGNVRELDNVLRRAAVFAREAIRPEDIGPPIVP
ncbi:MAG: sigma 54-interacting transcriptional regulator [Planctomycetes bacterium]|nr:sigma 54-interacting transcriptional regulator [Planctomycetota bacterium]